MPYKDKEKQKEKNKEYQKKYYESNKEYYNLKSKVRKQMIREFITGLKLKCSKCGESHPACLDFHHTDSTQKEINIGAAVSSGWSIERLQTEIDKCIILCANCHRKHHYIGG